jgi:UDP-N-acetylglucosamine diphosphorylase / glucose-1-phosphate thymidylyltransferase / UDP-N-acetylgalactosamine diphosphorylase / glucosamine-1-phosphate N-acetyltransferase / galactosamine-1-phosphate N-acetyltransferase
MIIIDDFIKEFSNIFSEHKDWLPWEITKDLSGILLKIIIKLNGDYNIKDGIAVHKTAIIENGAILKSPVIINENCFVGANAYLRGGVYLGKSSKIGPSCEIKSSIIFSNSCLAHLNFIGDSIIGSNVNFEAGSVIANYYNERNDKRISVVYNSEIINTGTDKFGALVGDNSKIGANAVLSPGTILIPNTIVKRLELIEQLILK